MSLLSQPLIEVDLQLLMSQANIQMRASSTKCIWWRGGTLRVLEGNERKRARRVAAGGCSAQGILGHGSL